MENGERLYGRRRVKKFKPAVAESPKNPEAEGQKAAPAEETPKEIPPIIKPEVSVETRKESESNRPRSSQPPQRREQRRPERKPNQYGDRKRDRSDSRPGRDRDNNRFKGKARTKVSVIIPAYNEEDNVQPLLDQFDEVIKKSGAEWEVIYVNDGSTDRTEERARKATRSYPWLKVTGYSRNRGLTAALNTGFKQAHGSIMVFYPADLQYSPQDIPRMIARIDQGADVVAGWKQGKYNKRLVSFIYNKICRMLFGLKIHDMNSVKAFKKDVVDSITLRRDWHRYLVVLAAEQGFVIDEVKVKLFPRKFGKSKFGAGRIMDGVLDLFSVKFQISFVKKPLRLFGTWGFILGGSGGIVGLLALYLRYFTEHGSRTLLFPTILLVLSGLLLFAIGFLAEMMVGLREEIESLRSRR